MFQHDMGSARSPHPTHTALMQSFAPAPGTYACHFLLLYELSSPLPSSQVSANTMPWNSWATASDRTQCTLYSLPHLILPHAHLHLTGFTTYFSTSSVITHPCNPSA